MRWGHGIAVHPDVHRPKRKRPTNAGPLDLEFQRAARRFHHAGDGAERLLNEPIDLGGSPFAAPIDARVLGELAHNLSFIRGKVRPMPLRLLFGGLFQRRGKAPGDLQLLDDALHHFRRPEQIPRERHFAGIAGGNDKVVPRLRSGSKAAQPAVDSREPVEMAQKFGAEYGQLGRRIALAQHVGIHRPPAGRQQSQFAKQKSQLNGRVSR